MNGASQESMTKGMARKNSQTASRLPNLRMGGVLSRKRGRSGQILQPPARRRPAENEADRREPTAKRGAAVERAAPRFLASLGRRGLTSRGARPRSPRSRGTVAPRNHHERRITPLHGL